jgi:hypothetical protein
MKVKDCGNYDEGSNDNRRMKHFLVTFGRSSTGSFIAFVAATNIKNPRKGLHAIFENKFPGWDIFMTSISERDFNEMCNEAHEVSKVNWDVRHPNLLFVTIENVRGNFFDPAWF